MKQQTNNIEKRGTLFLSFTEAPLLTTFYILISLLGAIVIPLTVIYREKFINAGVEVIKQTADYKILIPTLSILILIFFYTQLSGLVNDILTQRIKINIQRKIFPAIARKTASLEYWQIENNETYDLINKFSDKTDNKENPLDKMFELCSAPVSIICNIISIIGVGIILTQVGPWVGVIYFTLTIPVYLMSIYSGKKIYNMWEKLQPIFRKKDYYASILINREFAHERMLFNSQKHHKSLWKKNVLYARKKQMIEQFIGSLRITSSNLFSNIYLIIILLILVKSYVEGKTTIGLIIGIVSVLPTLQGIVVHGIGNNINILTRAWKFSKDMKKFFNLQESGYVFGTPNNVEDFDSIEFRNVRFKYPKTDIQILNGVSFKITNGKHYAFVGENGAGKSTIIKLLAGLYTPDKGEILINDKNIQEYSRSELNGIVSVLFQDFAKYFITVKQNIGLGDFSKLENLNEIRKAARNSDVDKRIEIFEKKYDTHLGKIVEGGLDMSGGEWQRIALARSYISQAPVKILDEPTAALDPVSETNIYKHYNKLMDKKTTILISHRLGSTAFADEIFVLDQGEIREHGTHKELMEHKGIYSKMFNLQSDWYLKEGGVVSC